MLFILKGNFPQSLEYNKMWQGPNRLPNWSADLAQDPKLLLDVLFSISLHLTL